MIDANRNAVAATIGVHKQPYAISVDAAGRRAFVANAGSNSVSVIDLDSRREVARGGDGRAAGAGAHRAGRAVAGGHKLRKWQRLGVRRRSRAGLRTARAKGGNPLHLRAAFPGCPGATDAVILPDSSKAFVACSGGHQVMAINLAAAPDSWAAKQNPSLMTDRVLALLDVGQKPVQLAMKPDGGEIFCSNFGSDSVSEIETWTNEVGGTYMIGKGPVHGIVSPDNSMLWVSNFGANSLSLYSIDDGRVVSNLVSGAGPDALAFSADAHLLLAADAHSGDVSVIRTGGKAGPALFTLLRTAVDPIDLFGHRSVLVELELVIELVVELLVVLGITKRGALECWGRVAHASAPSVALLALALAGVEDFVFERPSE